MPTDSSLQGVQDIWLISREYDGLAGVGGVKDVCRQLAETLVEHGGRTVQVVLPAYGFIDIRGQGFSPLPMPENAQQNAVFFVDMHYPSEERRERITVWSKRIKGVAVYLLQGERFSEKNNVYTYTSQDEELTPWQQQGTGHYDYFAMNILLQKGALDLMLLLDRKPDIIHCHDGHAAVLPAMMRENPGYRIFFRNTGAVVTIHNAGQGYHQEVADRYFARTITGLPVSVIRQAMLNDCFDPFMAAADYALMNTVSENYGRELQQSSEDARTGWLGHSLLERGIELSGITNGINPEDFNPSRADSLGIEAPFNPRKGELDGKRICKVAMLTQCSGSGLSEWQLVQQFGTLSPGSSLPLFTFIGRLTTQKGVDVLLGAVREFRSPMQLLILGAGDSELEEELITLTEDTNRAGSVCFLKGYDQALATRIYAAGDFFLIPSLYEPCGLTDYIAQLLGNLPIVHHVGGLVKVLDSTTGFCYEEHSAAVLAETMQLAIALYNDPGDALEKMQQAAVERIYNHHGWPQVMDDYLRLYAEAKECSSYPQT